MAIKQESDYSYIDDSSTIYKTSTSFISGRSIRYNKHCLIGSQNGLTKMEKGETKNVIQCCLNICLSVISVSLVAPNYAPIFCYIYRIRWRVLTDCLVGRMRILGESISYMSKPYGCEELIRYVYELKEENGLTSCLCDCRRSHKSCLLNSLA